MWTSPQGVTNFDDVVAAIETFQAGSVGDMAPRTDDVPQEPNRLVSFADVQWLIFAFKRDAYAFGCPNDPCRDNILNPCP